MQAQKNEFNFNGQNIYAGIDVHLKSWTVCIMTEHLEHKQFTQPPDAKTLYNYLARNFPGANYYTVYESGFSGFGAHRQLEELGIHSMITNAADVPTSQKEKLGKTDPVDSRKLARSLRSKDLDAIYIPSEATVQDRGLLRMRSTLVKDLSRFKQRTKSLLYFHSIPYPPQFSKSSCHWSKNFLRWLKEDIQFCEESGRQTLDIILQAVEELRKLLLLITRHIKALSTKEKYAANVNLLKTVPGIGLITAMTLLTEIETIDRFKDTDHFAGYVGLIPIRSDSGEVKKDGEMTFRGQRKLKRCLVESSWVAARTDPALSLTYNKLVFRMEANKAIIRIARKLLNRIYRVLKNKTEYVKCVVK